MLVCQYRLCNIVSRWYIISKALSGAHVMIHVFAGESNPEHFFVATQDRGLRSAVDRVPGGASIFASVNGLHLQVCLGPRAKP